ncbi:hypothetical protein [Chryseobacterium tongliaoense]|uniref:hypothetical protein n=1 Tax=Chryseobacterium tongliaoense TaxID=3240933 RepID=UPI003519116F
MATSKKNQKYPGNSEDQQEISENDLKMYDLIDTILEKKQDAGFPLGFSDKIIQKIEARQERRFNLKLSILFSVLLIVGLGFLFTFFSENQFPIMTSTFLKYKFMVIFILFMVISVQLSSRFSALKKLES